MKDDNCIFCKLANGVIPTNVIYENDMFTVIMDASPATRGHVLILPKEHYANLYEIDDMVAGEAFKLAKRLAIHMKKVLKCDGVNILQNNEEAAGQTVFHFHMHVIPRYKDAANNEGLLEFTHEEITEEDMNKIKDALSAGALD